MHIEKTITKNKKLKKIYLNNSQGPIKSSSRLVKAVPSFQTDRYIWCKELDKIELGILLILFLFFEQADLID